jgi:hypothetical protein
MNLKGIEYYTVVAFTSETLAEAFENEEEFCRWLTDWIEVS